jgi:glycosyltransferase involved in cell wall biosynthesis
MLKEALDSVCEQTHKDFEVVVADDASTDGTPDVLESAYDKFRKRSVTLKALRLTENSGYQCVPKNMAIYASRGDYIAYLDDDNLWDATHLEKLHSPFIDNLELDLTYCWRRYEGEGGIDIDPHPPEWEKAAPYIKRVANLIDTSDIMHSRGLAYLSFFHFQCIWNENERRFGDHSLLKRFIALGARGRLVPEELTTYRWHGNNLMVTRPIMEGYAPLEVSVAEKELKKAQA